MTNHFGRVKCGVDVVDVRSFSLSVEHGGDEFLAACFSATEVEECADRLESLAGRFAAKEAFLKALGTGIRGVRLSDVVTRKSANGKPTLVLQAGALRESQGQGWISHDVSISHDATIAIAMVVALCREGSDE